MRDVVHNEEELNKNGVDVKKENNTDETSRIDGN